MSMKVEIEGVFLGFAINAMGKHSLKISVVRDNKESSYRIGAIKSNMQGAALPAMYTAVRVVANDANFYDMNGQKGLTCTEFLMSPAGSSASGSSSAGK